MTQVTPIDPGADSRWVSFIDAHEEATIFHHPLWMLVLQDTYGYRQRSLGVLCDDKLTGILPLLEIRSWLTGKRGVCLPFSDACGPLLQDEGAMDQLLSASARLAQEQRWRYLEIRRCLPLPSVGASSSYKWHVIPLPDDSGKAFHAIKRTHVQHIARAERDGIVVERRQDKAALQEFIRLNALTRKKHGVPPQPDKFFFSLHQRLLSAGHGFISLALLKDRVIAASLFLHYKRCLHYKYSASDESYLEHSPNHLIVWDAIRWACAQGFSELDFGRSDADNEGLLRYKRAWGAVESDISYHHLADAGPRTTGLTSGALEHVKPILRRMPVPALKFIGRMLYEHAE